MSCNEGKGVFANCLCTCMCMSVNKLKRGGCFKLLSIGGGVSASITLTTFMTTADFCPHITDTVVIVGHQAWMYTCTEKGIEILNEQLL